jgi:hypothetical protein
MARKNKESNLRHVGDVVMRAIDSVKPNTWNPNKMTAFQRESLKSGLKSDGWLKSQALLIWGTDEQGAIKSEIIDGEHRWTAAKLLGFEEAPMVVLDGLKESQAKALTIKMNSKRGEFDTEDLAVLIRSLVGDLDVADLGMELGVVSEDLMKMLGDRPDIIQNEILPDKPTAPDSMPSGKTGHVKMVQLFFDSKEHDVFLQKINILSKKLGTKNVTETIIAALNNVDCT